MEPNYTAAVNRVASNPHAAAEAIENYKAWQPHLVRQIKEQERDYKKSTCSDEDCDEAGWYSD